ncbi:hypothetical protein [Paludibacterium denitrificans]|uniref:Uncharacterized protein n=1 Tax=Paludibacterium denitrificans TaxID=2675226 RepID=A0A844GD13_9NEIS|nr:hypothetical protein [Paludibacterium denitrificans]MTD33549.1 hypothetical protein [Paludibacterium denitrificans]
MGLALNKLLEQMEARRCCCLGTECVTHVEAVRTLEIPISGEVCTELRAMAEVFNAQPAELAKRHPAGGIDRHAGTSE